jgi:NDP-sugar pyrophosphorylase family protein
MKALILAGGRGDRLHEMTAEVNKCMLVFGGRPLIEHSLEIARTSGIGEVVIVVGYLGVQIINHYGNGYLGLRIRYAVQEQQLGLVHAIECSRAEIGDSDFLLLLGDEFFVGSRHGALFEEHRREDAFATCGVVRVDDPTLISKTYAILPEPGSNRIIRLIEKPRRATNDLMGTGNVVFKNRIFDYVAHTPINPLRGERELPDLIQCAVDDGEKVIYHVLGSTYFNVNTPDDVIVVTHRGAAPPSAGDPS